MRIWIISTAFLALLSSLTLQGQKTEEAFTNNNLPSQLDITDVVDNRDRYPNSQIPRYEKFEITFQISGSAATNYFFPYDSNPPDGVDPGKGITVNALFTPDNWETTYTQPAFFYKAFEYQVKGGQDWIYPTGSNSWKVRFAPTQTGIWQYRLQAIDLSGTIETAPASFSVATSNNKGFIRVSQSDIRYFEYENGTYFPGLGYNMNFDHVSWNDPVTGNQHNFEVMGANGIQLLRIWLSQWAIFGSMWNPWAPANELDGGLYAALTMSTATPGSEVSMALDWDDNPAMFLGWLKRSPAVKPNTNYKVSITYAIPADLNGPRLDATTYPDYGLVMKLGGWLNNGSEEGYSDPCGSPNAAGSPCDVFTAYANQSTWDPVEGLTWATLTGEIDTGSVQYQNVAFSSDFLPYLYLVLENVGAPGLGQGNVVYIDRVEIREDLGDGQLGPNIIQKPWMAHHQYVDQRNSFAFDQVIELARANGVYIRPVVQEKNDWILNRINYEGNNDPSNPTNDNFYGNFRTLTKVRWLQQAWWRYLQARWGYSTNIHSWELLNEGDPYNGRHYALADEFGKFMHQFAPNDHLVSTSNWHSFPKDYFWDDRATGDSYPDVDYAIVHQYTPNNSDVNLRVDVKDENGIIFPNMIQIAEVKDWYDSALNTYRLSMAVGALQPYGAGKPTMRGEAGFTDSGSEPGSNELLADTTGIWLHNFIWGGINPGGVIESYWYENLHIYTQNFDHRSQYKHYYDFIKDVPLSNGFYVDAQAVVDDSNLRAWGQKDLINGRAHLWIANSQHTWKNVLDGVSISPINGTVTIGGFTPGKDYPVEWWHTYSGNQTNSTQVIADSSGNLSIPVSGLTSDVAVRIGIYPQSIYIFKLSIPFVQK